MGLNAEKSGDVGRVMIVAITDGRANISLKRSTDPEAAEADAPRPSAQELKVVFTSIIGYFKPMESSLDLSTVTNHLR